MGHVRWRRIKRALAERNNAIWEVGRINDNSFNNAIASIACRCLARICVW